MNYELIESFDEIITIFRELSFKYRTIRLNDMVIIKGAGFYVGYECEYEVDIIFNEQACGFDITKEGRVSERVFNFTTEEPEALPTLYKEESSLLLSLLRL